MYLVLTWIIVFGLVIIVLMGMFWFTLWVYERIDTIVAALSFPAEFYQMVLMISLLAATASTVVVLNLPQDVPTTPPHVEVPVPVCPPRLFFNLFCAGE